MKKLLLLPTLILLTFYSLSAQKILVSAVYDGKKDMTVKTPTGEEMSYFSSPTKKLELFEIKAITLNSGKTSQVLEIGKGTDELIIVKEGTIDVQVNKELKVMGEGSLVLASQGDKLTFSNKQNSKAVYYSISFKPFPSTAQNQVAARISPLFFNWKTLEFKPGPNGGRRDVMRQRTTNLKELEIHITTLKAGVSSHAGHSHPDEEFVLMRYGSADMDLDGVHNKGGAGSIFFLASGGTHSLSNVGTDACEYYAIRWLTE